MFVVDKLQDQGKVIQQAKSNKKTRAATVKYKSFVEINNPFCGYFRNTSFLKKSNGT